MDLKEEIMWVKLVKLVPGLPYKIGMMVPVAQGRFGLVWHVWKTIIRLPKDSYST